MATVVPFAPISDADYSTRWICDHRGHATAEGRSAFALWRDSLWGPWRVWCGCGASIVTSHASGVLMCVVARRGVLRMDVEKRLTKTGDQKAAIG